MKNIIKHGVQIVVTITLMLLLLLGGAAPFGQDEPDATPTPVVHR
jgi:hypothetical protein